MRENNIIIGFCIPETPQVHIFVAKFEAGTGKDEAAGCTVSRGRDGDDNGSGVAVHSGDDL